MFACKNICTLVYVSWCSQKLEEGVGSLVIPVGVRIISNTSKCMLGTEPMFYLIMLKWFQKLHTHTFAYLQRKASLNYIVVEHYPSSIIAIIFIKAGVPTCKRSLSLNLMTIDISSYNDRIVLPIDCHLEFKSFLSSPPRKLCISLSHLYMLQFIEYGRLTEYQTLSSYEEVIIHIGVTLLSIKLLWRHTFFC